MKLEYNRIVDLTHVLTPGEGAGGKERKLETHMKFVEEVVTGIKRKDDDDWYIMHDVELMNHIGSHIEVPYHYFKDGDDLIMELESQGSNLIREARALEKEGNEEKAKHLLERVYKEFKPFEISDKARDELTALRKRIASKR